MVCEAGNTKCKGSFGKPDAKALVRALGYGKDVHQSETVTLHRLRLAITPERQNEISRIVKTIYPKKIVINSSN